MDIVEDIKNRISIEDICGQYVQLKKAGRNFKACCPFHEEKTASFVVSPEKQIAYCFGCNKGGDIFRFIQEIEGITFTEAIDVLADKCGLDVTKYAVKKSGVRKEEKDRMLLELDRDNERYKSGFGTEDGKKVKEYLHKRGVTDETIGKFEIGFASDFENDRFKRRLIFPIRDHMGRIVGFGGRAVSKDDQPKYLNSPESKIYHKGNILYGLYYAKQAIKEKDFAFVVEGYMDTIMCAQAGYENVVASSGTALTENQLKLLKRYTANLYFSFDMDEAGLEATKRAYLLALEHDMNVKVVEIEEKDPADCIKDDPNKFSMAVEEAKPFMEFYFDKVFGRNDVTGIEGKQRIFNEVLPFLKIIPNKVQQDHYVRIFARRVNMKESQIYDEISRLNLPASHPSKSQAKIDKVKLSVSDFLLGFLLEFPSLYDDFKERISESDFSDMSKSIYKIFTSNYNAVRSSKNISVLTSIFSEDEAKKANFLSLYIETNYEDFSDENVRSEMDRLIHRLDKCKKEGKKSDLQRKIKDAEKEGDKKEYLKLLSELQEVLK